MMELALSPLVLVALALVGLFAGIGITAIGPGGVFITSALALTTATPATVAGTASATNIVAGLLGTLMYAYSGELRTASGTRMVGALSGPGIAGTLVGIWLNRVVSASQFTLILGVVVVLAGVLVWYRARYRTARLSFDSSSLRGSLAVAAIGIGVGVSGGLLGVGGPVLAVPLLITLGVELLPAIAAAQVQSVCIAGLATIGYLAQDAVSLSLVLLIGIPELIGIVIGWRLAQTVDTRQLTLVLAAVLIGLGSSIVLGL